MKKRCVKIALCSVLALFVMTTLGTPVWASQDKPMKLIYATFDPEAHPWTPAMKKWAAEMEERTKGKVKVQLSFGGALVKVTDSYDKVKSGIVDMALVVPAFSGPGRFPMVEIVGLPYRITNAVAGTKAFMAFADKGYLDKEFGDVIATHFRTGAGDTLFTTKKPVKNLADFKGLKLFATTPTTQQKVKLMGGTPVAVPIPDLYPALQKGVIDGAIFTWIGMRAWKLAEVLKFATLPATGTVVTTIVMNKNTYNKLPPEGRAMVDETKLKYALEYATPWDGAEEDGKQFFLEKGGKMLQWEAEALKEIEKRVSPMWSDWIKAKEAKGLPGQKAVDDLYNILKEQGMDPPAVGYKIK